MNEYEEQNPLKPTEIRCMFLVVDDKIYVSVQDLENAYQKILQKNDSFIEEGRHILERQGIDVNNDFKCGFKSGIQTLSAIIHEQASNLNVDLELKEYWNRKSI